MVRKIRHLKKSSTRGRRHHRRFQRMTASAMAERRAQIESLEPRVVLAADPLISEFQAINTSTLADEDGDFEDWIEIRNPDIASVDVGGWYLTDDDTDLTKWRFPASTVIESGQQLLVFASNKDRNNGPESQLHTNFRLSGTGEYLALVKPDGITVSQAFAPYPPQFEDQSYGLAVGRDVFEMIPSGANVKSFVPTDDSLANTWQDVGFDDSAWASGTAGVGFEELTPGFEVNETFDTALGAAWTVSLPPGASSTVNVTGGALVLDAPTGQIMEFDSRGTAPIVFRSLPESPADYELVTRVSQGLGDRGAAGIVVVEATTGLPVVQLEYSSRLNFRLIISGDRKGSKVSLSRSAYSLRLVRDGLAKTWTGYYRLNDTDDWTQVGEATDGIDDVPIINDPRVGLYARTPTSTMTANFENFDIKIPDQRPVYGPEIGLDVKAAMQNQNSSIYLRIPFTFDQDPSILDELAMSARFDDGFIAYLNGVKLTEDNVPIQSTWNSSATTAFGAVNGQIPVRQFGVSASLDAVKQGENVLAVHAMNVAKDDLDFFFDTQMIASDILNETEQFFVVPTPGASNELPAAPIPVISGQQGVFFGSRDVALSLPTPIASLEIRYTLDGSIPLPSSPLYTGPLTLTASAMLEARAYDTSPSPNFAPSNAASGTFIAIDTALQSVTSDLPLVVLTTLGQGLKGAGSSDLTSMNVSIFERSKVDGRSALDSNLVDYLGRGGARNRGSSTGGQAKPNMAFEIWGKSGTDKDDDENASLLGMPSDSDWVLHAPFSFDRAFIRNQLAFDLSRDMDMWASRFRQVEVYLDNRGDGIISDRDYVGIYVLMEKIAQNNDKVDVGDITRDDNATDPNNPLGGPVSGGYIWKVDRADPDAAAFTAGGQSINWVYPKSPRSRTAREDQKATLQQQDWVTNFFNEFAATLRSPDINDPEGYAKYIDPVSWADQHMLNVFMMNVDALRLSAYFYKDRDGRVDYGPVWDFDRSAESNDDRDDDPFKWRAQTGDRGTDFFGNGTQRWWGDLFKDPGFWQVYVDRWQQWRDTVFSDEAVGQTVDKLAGELMESQVRNTAKWSQSRPRTSSGYKRNVLNGTYQGEIDNLKKWMRDRASFFDSNFAQRAEVKVRGEALGTADGANVSVGEVVDITPPPLPFFTDTTLIDGEAGATTATYFIPGDDTLGRTWTEISFDDASWSSGPLGFGFDNGTDFADLIKTEVEPNLAVPGSTTNLIRIPFEITDLEQAKEDLLILRTKFDDGFVAYLNGQRVHDRQLRDDGESWNSRARSRRDTEAVIFEDKDLSEFSDLLVLGTNILALRSINSSATGNDMLMLPALVTRNVSFGVNPDARVYYTTDGTDPRAPDGQPSDSATLLLGGGSITVDDSTRVIARNFDDSFRGTESNIVLTDWSGPVQYDLITSSTSLAISEINYNPADPSQAEADAGYSSGDFEFLEIQNTGPVEANLVGVQLTDGVQFDFFQGSTLSLAPGARTLVVSNPTAFAMRYGNNLPVAGQFTGSLDDNGEDIDLKKGTGEVIFSVNYSDSDPWPATADGLGATLELVKPNLSPSQQGKWYSWRSSTEFGGSPGSDGAGPVGVVINEVLANTNDPVKLDDSIELYNTTGSAINVGGWFLSDSGNRPFKFQIPAGTTIPSNGYVVYTETDFNAPNDPNRFALSGKGDDVYLTQGSVAGGITQFVDDVQFRATLIGESLGRIPNGSGRLSPLTRTTLGAVNTAPRVGPLVISEIQYNPLLTSEVSELFPTIEESDLEFLEIHNPTSIAVDLTNWRLRGGADYNFEDGTSIAAGETIVLLKFNPTDPENINELKAFRVAYGVSLNVRLLGGYGGQLNNSDDLLILLRPDVPEDEFIPRVQEDEVLYDDVAPWPTNADGTGLSLQRTATSARGNDPASWFGSRPTPGELGNPLVGDMDRNGVVDADDINAMFAQMKSASPDPSFDLNGDGSVGETDRDILVEQLIGTRYGDANFDFIFNSSDLVTTLSFGQYEDGVPNNSTWQTGDWDGDGDFTTGDLVLGLARGSYSTAAVPGNQNLISAALQSSGDVRVAADAESDSDLVEAVTRRRPLQDEAIQTVDSLFADAPAAPSHDDTADDLVDSLLGDDQDWV